MKKIIVLVTASFLLTVTLSSLNVSDVLAEQRTKNHLTQFEVGYGIGFIDGYWGTVAPKLYNSPKMGMCHARNVKVKYYKSKKDGLLGKTRNAYGYKKYKNKKDFCTIKLNMSTMYNQPSWKVCLTMVHEYGHLMGLGHSRDRNNIMYGQYDSHNDLIPGCKNAHP